MDELGRRPTSALTEADLEHGGLGERRPRVLREPCACGGVIQADDDDHSIAAAVHIHNESTGHARWARLTGYRHDGQAR